jgi:hypothetical protein
MRKKCRKTTCAPSKPKRIIYRRLLYILHVLALPQLRLAHLLDCFHHFESGSCIWYLATRTAANLRISIRNVGLLQRISVLVKNPRIRPKAWDVIRQKRAFTAFGYEHGFLASRAFVGRDGQPMSITTKMRMPICSSAVCRQLRSNVSLRVQRSALSPWSRLQQTRCNSSGKFLSCDSSSDPAPVILQSVGYEV